MERIARYQISCRVLAVAPGQFLAEVSARVHGANAADGEAHSESRLFASLDVAKLECGLMVETMRRRLASAGHEVVDAAQP